jgi:hypothetical protein
MTCVIRGSQSKLSDCRIHWTLSPFVLKSAIRAQSILLANGLASCVTVGPCHQGMARPQVADRGTASDKEGSCE